MHGKSALPHTLSAEGHPPERVERLWINTGYLSCFPFPSTLNKLKKLMITQDQSECSLFIIYKSGEDEQKKFLLEPHQLLAARD